MKQSILLSVLVLLMLVVPSHFSYSQNNEAKNIKMAETYWTEVWSKGNLQAVADFYHPNAKHGEDFTIEGFQKSVASLREAFPDFKVTINDIFATGNRVVCEVTYTGSHTGRKMFKQEPLGKLVTVPGIDIFTFKDGKCINHQHVADHLDLVMQMGIQLTPTAPDKKD